MILYRSSFFYIQRCIPISASQTKMEYEVYKGNDANDEDFTKISDFFKQVLKEDKGLCNGAQTNLNAGLFMSGELHPRVEKVCIPFSAYLGRLRRLIRDRGHYSSRP